MFCIAKISFYRLRLFNILVIFEVEVFCKELLKIFKGVKPLQLPLKR